jgi:hypothetical protein
MRLFRGGREGAQQEHKLPALLFREFGLENGHGLFAFADFVEELAVGAAVHEFRIGEIGRRGIVTFGIGPVTGASVSVAVRAFIFVDGSRGLQRAIGRLQGVLELFGFLWNGPGGVGKVIRSVHKTNGDNGKNHDEEEFFDGAIFLGRDGHG